MNTGQSVAESSDTAASGLLPGAFLSGKRWRIARIDERAALAMQQKTGLPEILCRLLVHRGVTWEEAENYLAPSLKNLMPDPFSLKDMDIAVTRIIQAISAGETIGVFGDYDVDGATSSALLLHYFRWIGVKTAVHIPDRQKEGYGPNLYGFSRLREKGARLIITVDTGTLAHEALQAAKAEGYEVIVVDHHLGEPLLPQAVAVVNPNRFDETSPLKQLAAVGVTFLLLVALQQKLREGGFFSTGNLSSAQSGIAQGQASRHFIKEPDLRWLLDIVALGTVADVVPLTGLNRAFVAQGLKILRQRQNPGLTALMDVSALDEAPNCYHCGFLLGPRINAGGRVGQSDMGVQLLTAMDYESAKPLASQLDLHNKERKAIEAAVLEQAMELAMRQANYPVIIVGAEGWHEGVIGIVAGRLKEHFNRPAAAIAWNSDGKGKASARSVSGVDLGQSIIAAKQRGLLLAGGGHAMAAGFTVAREHFEPLQSFLAEQLGESITHYHTHYASEVEGQLPVSALTLELAALLERAGPYGAGNATPRLQIPRVKIIKADTLKEKHLRLIAVDAEAFNSPARVKIMGFGMAELDLGQALLNHKGRSVSLIGKLKAESWQGRESVTFLLEDAAFC